MSAKFSLIVLSLATCVFIAAANTLTGDALVEKPELYIQKSNDSILEVDFAFPGVSHKQIDFGEEQFDLFYMDDLGATGDIGSPELPVITKLFAIPDQAKVIIRSVEPQYKTYQGFSPYPHQEYEYDSPYNTEDLVFDAKYYDEGGFYPDKWVTVGTPAIMRDLRVIPVNIMPVRVDASTGEVQVLTGLHLELEYAEGSTENVKTHHFSKTVPTFNSMYENLVSNYDWINPNGEEVKGSILIIYPNVGQTATILAPYIEWKKRRGYATTAIGVSNNASTTTIFNQIQTAYNTFNPPLEHVILVGDATGTLALQCYTYSGGYTDHSYALLEGGDILAEITIGRISVDNITTLMTAINKILYYEKNPTLLTTDWYHRGAVTAGSGSGYSCVMVHKNIRDWWLEDGFTQVDTMWYTMGGSIPSFITTQCNQGVTGLSYRGYWGVSGFTTGNIMSLTNSGKLPFAVMITCGTGDFGSTGGVAINEAWLRAGTPTNPTGGIGGVSTATSSTHTRFNNTVVVGIWWGAHAEEMYELGPMTFRGKYELWITYQMDPSGMANFTYWNNLMGDPTTDWWSDVPQQLTVTYPSQISVGTSSFSVTVEDAAGNPLEGRYVTFLKGSETYLGGNTDENGVFTSPINVPTAGDLLVTVTNHNDYPHLGTVTVSDSPVNPSFNSLTINDDNIGASQGNGDGTANPGETLELDVQLKNFGTSNIATALNATLSSVDANVDIITASSTYPNLSAGAVAFGNNKFVVQLDNAFANQYVIPFTLTVNSTQGQFISAFNVTVTSADLNIFSSGFTGGTLPPGEQRNYNITLKNLGQYNLTGVTAVMTTDDPQVTIIDGSSSFGSINAGAQAANSGDLMNIAADDMATDGHRVAYNLHITSSNGFEQDIPGAFIIGVITDADPWGPDEYGYYCIDNTDLEYSGRADYVWTNISSTGTPVSLPDFGNEQDASARIILPFTFSLYGQQDSIITACSNGWLAMGDQTYFTDFRNYPIPSALGANSSMICPLWDNLVMSGGGVYKYYDAANHRYIVQYNAAHQSGGSEIFQVILYDPLHYPTPTGDGEIVFMYNTYTSVVGPSSDNDYSTVGIENEEHSGGMQYCYWNIYAPGAADLSDQRAIKFTTVEPVKTPISNDVIVTLTPAGMPIVIPPQGGSFNFNILLDNLGATQSIFDMWTFATLPDQTQYGPILVRNNIVLNSGGTLTRDMTQTVPAGAPTGNYIYTAYVGEYSATPEIWDQDSFVFAKSGTDAAGSKEWPYIGWDDAASSVILNQEIPSEFKFFAPSPNPFNPSVNLSFDLPYDGYVKLVVYNSLGRLAAELTDGWRQAGTYNLKFDGTNFASGLYFAQLQFGGEIRTQKMLLIK